MTFSQERDTFSSENPYSYRIPLDRNIEWIIKSEEDHKNNLIENGMSNYISNRDILLHQIKMIGDKNFIMEEDFTIRGRQYYEFAPLRSRINFLNYNEFDVSNSLYEDYINNNDIENIMHVVTFDDGSYYTFHCNID